MPDNIINELDKNLLIAFFRFHKVIFHKVIKPDKNSIFKNNKKLRFGDYNLLFHIRAWTKFSPEGTSSAELSGKMHVKPPTINPLLLNLEKEHLIKRRVDTSDRRILRITLTPDGKKLTDVIEEALCMRMHEMVNYLGIDKSKKLYELMDEAYTYMNEHS